MSITTKCKWNVVLLTLLVFIILSFALISQAASSKPAQSPALPPEGGGGGGEVGGTGTVMTDLFLGQMGYRIPIEVPTGRKGMQPNLALNYRSNSGNGWVGVGWDLEIWGIERNALHGVNYGDDNYILRMAGSAIELIFDDSAGFYRAKIEGIFYRIQKITDGQIFYWQLTDKNGRRYLFGQTADSRQDDPDHSTKIFKWCLDHVEDANGNYMDITYDKHPSNGAGAYEGQIYLKQIAYAGNASAGAQPSNYVNFYLEPRTDAPDMYTTKFRVKTAFRLEKIDIYSGNNMVRRYKLDYSAYSVSSQRSLLANITLYGSDGVTILPVMDATYEAFEKRYEPDPAWNFESPVEKYFVTVHADMNGDGKTDILYINGSTFHVLLSTGSGFGPDIVWGTANDNTEHIQKATIDVNGDGLTDIVYRLGKDYHVLLSTGSKLAPDTIWGTATHSAFLDIRWFADVNGDGLVDAIYPAEYPDYGVHVMLSTGQSFGPDTFWLEQPGWSNYSALYWLEDMDGDGRADICYAKEQKLYVMRSTGSIFGAQEDWGTIAFYTPNMGSYWLSDMNGDGLPDFAYYDSYNNIRVMLNNGNAFANSTFWGVVPPEAAFSSTAVLDLNGDGLADWQYLVNQKIHTMLSTGSGFDVDKVWGQLDVDWKYGWLTDVDGDGLLDYVYTFGSNINIHVLKNIGPYPDLLKTVSNGIGGSITIKYTASTQYQNTRLPFPVLTVSSISANDGNGGVSTTSLTHSGGFYHIAERDFRGFNYAKVTGPMGPNGEQAITETWFHQGKDTAVDVNNPDVVNSYMKGKPYHTRVTDASGAIYTETTSGYASIDDNTAHYFFNPTQTVDSFICDGKVQGHCDINTAARHIQTVYTYDQSNGNLLEEDQYGDVADARDDRTVIKTYSPNTTAWILGLPTSESTYAGIGTTGQLVALTTFYYDGVIDCNTASTIKMPTKGNLTRIVRRLDGVTDPEVRMAYDTSGNLFCSRDARGNVSKVSYDSSFTFPTESTTPPVGTNPLGYKTTTKYYGVDGIQADKGLYGQVKSITDPNGAETIMEYDTFGRKKMTINPAPDGAWTSWSYPITPGTGTSTNTFGAVGVQNIQTDTAVGISSWTYFDGFGRTIIEKNTGPGGKLIATKTTYNKTGTVSKTTLPYFDGTAETPRWTNFTYDSMGRAKHIDNPDGTSVDSCYYNGVTVVIDADKHRKRETKNVQEKLVKVEEYLGTYATGCTTDVETPYATTTYEYDVLGNLLKVTDAEGNQTTMQYDNLGRKIKMQDPDMGNWAYAYDANGNLIKQTDARGQIITFTYDSFNRVTKKHYPRLTFGPDVVYTYDVAPASYPMYTTYPVGRLTTMTDVSGTTTLFYDNMGRTKKTIKTISGTSYPIDFAYTLGRLTSVTYPDGDVVNYSYDGGGNLDQATDPSTNKAYATYANFNALAQPGNVTYGNAVTTAYEYYPTNNRLMGITTLDPTSQKLLSLTYNYSDGGNVNAITDNINSTRSQTFIYDDINRLIQAQSITYGTQWYAYNQIGNITSKEGVSYTYTDSSGATTKPHAVKSTTDGRTYTYDANGNMISNGVKSITYDYDNMPRSVVMNNAATTFVYDGGGARVKKTTSTGSTIYIGKLYECNGATCSKYILAGGSRIAHKSGTDTYYYHQDHLGSSRVVTNQTGTQVEDVYYYPFGAAQSDTGDASMSHKYTSQEFDSETGLYYYNARYYDPALGRFISADSWVPYPSNPQSLNRYSYVMNNPMNHIDPTGHSSDDYTSDNDDTGTCGYYNFFNNQYYINITSDNINSATVSQNDWFGTSEMLIEVMQPPVMDERGYYYATWHLRDTDNNANNGSVESLWYGFNSALNSIVPGASFANSAWNAGGQGNWGYAALHGTSAGLELGLFFLTMGESAVAKTAVKEAAINLHHALPKFLGGKTVQELSTIERSIHTEFHSLLRQNLNGAGIPLNIGGIGGSTADWARFMNISPGAQRTALDVTLDTSRAIDFKYGTNITHDVWDNLLQGTFTVFP